MQLGLFGEVAVDKTRRLILRDYQRRIAGQALQFLAAGKSPLTVAATGTGKTSIAAAVVRDFPGRVLWIAHRIELVRQAIERLEHVLGERVNAETASSYSDRGRVVVASKDTVRHPSRLQRLSNYDGFELIVVDECHHSPARTYQTIFDAYPNALRYGLTATPGRLDKRGLGSFDCSTEPFGIVEASREGWLVPIRAKREKVKSVDLSGVRVSAGDFNQAELDAVYRSEESLHAIGRAILDRLGHGPCLHFATTVGTAERQAEVINRYRPGTARVVHGNTPELERRTCFSELGTRYQVLVNVGVATEGTDLPSVAVISMGRATKSQSLFQQMLGRGLRPLPGVVDISGTAQERLAAIAASQKPHCLVLDFVGSTGRHSVATAVDGLSATETDSDRSSSAAVDRVKQRLEAGEELELAGALAAEIEAEQDRQEKRRKRKERELARRLEITGQVVLESRDVRLIGLGGDIADTDQARSVLDGPPTPEQVQELGRLGSTFERLETARDARRRILELRKQLDLASPKQVALITRHMPDKVRPGLTRKQAGFWISQITKRWR